MSDEQASAGSVALRLAEVRFAYGDDDDVLHGLELEVATGEVLGLLGPSGAGKTTTLKLLARLLRGHRGSIEVLGQPLESWGPELFEQVGVGFEASTHFLRLTGVENMSYIAGLHRRSCRDPRELLTELGLAEAADRPVATWSKGQRARLSLARALQHEPGLLLLDEPTGGLDPALVRQVGEVLRQQAASGRAVLLLTHDMTLADAACDRLAILHEGRIAALDTPRALKQAHGRRRVRIEVRADDDRVASEHDLDGLGEDEAFLAALHGGHLETMHTQEASLADVFIALTGRSL